MSQQRKFFPGWLVVASGFVIMATCYTIFVNCMSLFQPLIVSDLGITLAQYNVSNAISTVVSVVGSLVIGHVADNGEWPRIGLAHRYRYLGGARGHELCGRALAGLRALCRFWLLRCGLDPSAH